MRLTRSIFFLLACGAARVFGGQVDELGHADLQMVQHGRLPESLEQGQVGQLPDGRMLFSLAQQVLIQQGSGFSPLRLPQMPLPPSQIEGTPTGEILIGHVSYVAVARPVAAGGWQLTEWPRARYSLVDRSGHLTSVSTPQGIAFYVSAAGAQLVGDVWKAWDEPASEKPFVYLRSDRGVFRLNGRSELQRWTGVAWTEGRHVPGLEKMKPVMLRETSDGQWSFVGESGREFHIESGGSLRPGFDLSPRLGTDKVTIVYFLPSGGHVVRTLQGRILVVDPRGKIVSSLAEGQGLPAASVSSLFVDRSAALWMNLSGALARVDTPEHVTRFDREEGMLDPAVLAVVRHEGQLYAGTGDGVYRLKPGVAGSAQPARMERVPGLNHRTAVLLSRAGGLLAGSKEGVHVLGPTGFTLIAATKTPVNSLTSGIRDPASVHYSAAYETGTLLPASGGWTKGAFSNTRGTDVRAVLEAGETEWWIAQSRGEVARFVPSKPIAPAKAGAFTPLGMLSVRYFGQEMTRHLVLPLVPDQTHDFVTTLLRWGDRPVAVRRDGVRSLVADSEPLLDEDTENALVGNYRVRAFATSSTTSGWLVMEPTRESAAQGLGVQVREVVSGAKHPRRILPSRVLTVGRIHALWPETTPDGELLWIAGETGLLRMQLDGFPTTTAPSVPIVTASSGGAEVTPRYVLPSAHGALRFDFAAPEFGSGAEVAYRSRLTGHDGGEWTPYALQASRMVGRLGPGGYELAVQTRNRDGRESPVATLAFRVAPPWWLSAGGMTLLIVAGCGLGYGAWRAVASNMRRRQRQLEDLVATRTAELQANEAQLSLAKEQAVNANRAKSAFLAAMSHELRTPLNAILGFGQILRREPNLSTKGQSQLEVIDRNGKHLLEMINEVLDLSKIEANKMVLRPAPCSLRRLVSGLAETFEPRASEKGLTFRLEFGPGVPARVVADESKLRQVLINLIANAVKFTNQGEVVLTLSLRDNRIRFAVTDTGIGIAADEQASLFKPFHQSESANPGAGLEIPVGLVTGTGLGLAISQRLVELMGGLITVESEPGRGSRFSFELALAAAPAGSVEADPPVRVTGYNGPRRRLLVVDDEATNRAVLVEMLTVIGFEMTEVGTGEEAIEACARQDFDLVLLDLRLPGVDGREVARQISVRKPRPRLVAVSASVLDIDHNSADRSGCDEFVSKPIEEKRLLAAIARQLELIWVTETPGAPAVAQTTKPAATPEEILALPRPAAAVVAAWLDLARRGDLHELRRQIDAPAATGPDAAFRRELDGLAQSFRTGALRELLARAMASTAAS